MAQDDYGMRGQAAMRLLKGGKKAPPPEDDLGLPPEEEGAPPDGGGAPPMDLAAILGGMGGEGGAPPPGGAPPDAGSEPPMAPEGGEAPAGDLDSSLAGVENALAGLPEKSQDEIRVHLNAIREIASRGSVEGMAEQPVTDPAAGGPAEPSAPAPSEKEITG